MLPRVLCAALVSPFALTGLTPGVCSPRSPAGRVAVSGSCCSQLPRGRRSRRPARAQGTNQPSVPPSRWALRASVLVVARLSLLEATAHRALAAALAGCDLRAATASARSWPGRLGVAACSCVCGAHTRIEESRAERVAFFWVICPCLHPAHHSRYGRMLPSFTPFSTLH